MTRQVEDLESFDQDACKYHDWIIMTELSWLNYYDYIITIKEVNDHGKTSSSCHFCFLVDLSAVFCDKNNDDHDSDRVNDKFTDNDDDDKDLMEKVDNDKDGNDKMTMTKRWQIWQK